MRVERLSARSVRAAVLLAVGIVWSSMCAFAGTTSGTLAVSANVSNVCKVAAGTVAFGTYDPVNANAATALTQTGTFSMTCTKGTSATILLGQGSNPGTGSTNAAPIRNMLSGATQLNYQLYTTATYTTVWNNTTGVIQVATGTAQTINVYGSIPAAQNVASGAYTDTVVITVNY